MKDVVSLIIELFDGEIVPRRAYPHQLHRIRQLAGASDRLIVKAINHRPCGVERRISHLYQLTPEEAESVIRYIMDKKDPRDNE